jgi:hypothetical protein
MMLRADDYRTDADRDDLAREQRERRRIREEYLEDEKETYGTTES